MKKSFLTTTLLSLGIAAFGQIAVNQVGYYPQERKVAVMEPEVKAKSFTIKDASGKTVWSGKAQRKSVSPFNNKVRQIVNFSKLTKPGTYTIIAGKAKQQIVIKQNAFADATIAAMKSFYLQRTAMPIEAKYAGKYARPAAHMDDKVMIHPAAVSPGRPAGTIISSPYGWYDAGDFNKYIVNSGFTIGVMLQAYQLNKEYIDKMNLNIPESDNKVPDFLDEIMYNLKWMMTMQDPYDGGVYHKLTTPNFEGFIMPAEAKQQRYVTQKSTQAALDFAATMALAARIYAAYPEFKEFCKQAIPAAERAYAWAVKNPKMFYDQNGNNEKYEPKITTGMYDDVASSDEFFWAATELFFTTKQHAYLVMAKQFAPEKYSVPTWGNVAGLGVQEFLTQELLAQKCCGDKKTDDCCKEKAEKADNCCKEKAEKQCCGNQGCFIEAYKASLKEYCDACLDRMETSTFGNPHGNRTSDFAWGSNSENCAGQGIALMYQYIISGEKKYQTAALAEADYIFGRNATGYCFLTGFGTKQVMHPHQRLSHADGIEAPLPGFLAGGPNPGQQDKATCNTYPSNDPDESYTDDMNSYASNEIAINWNAYLVALLAWLDATVK